MSNHSILPQPSQKYDRQLRLWSSSGQHRLSHAEILLMGSTPTLAETAKNLALPGIAKITFLDSTQILQRRDRENQYFVREGVEGNRAREIARGIQELNPEIRVDAIEQDPTNYKDNLAFFSAYTLIQIPYIRVHSNGLLGFFRIQLQEHTVVETHADTPHDLRLTMPFPKLQAYSDAINMETVDRTHVSAVVLVIKGLEAFKSRHGRQPLTYQERTELRKILEQWQPGPSEENFDEAYSMLNRATTEYRIPSGITELLEASRQENKIGVFWTLARALRRFVDRHNVLPLSGKIPDMKADTNSYVRLQTIYHEKALGDAKEIWQLALEDLSITGNASSTSNTITMEIAQLFCKHAASLAVLYGSPLKDLELKTIDPSKENTTAVWLVIFLAAQEFQRKHLRIPGDFTLDTVKTDLLEMIPMVQALRKQCAAPADDLEVDMNEEDWRLHTGEFIRYGGIELHNIASLMGGLIAQEIIKIITSQFLPCNNTTIFDGIKSTMGVYRL